ncbi:hypothetical protein AABM38_16870 [Heyndrickxia sp. MSNUG]|uniref:hypothetical protein n=1 Tax=Heyndrickxia sp. MSNUG TaxID=3136677 RepID=UPI003C2AB80B
MFDLIGNPFVIFVLIGILSSLFNKAKGKGHNNQPPRPVRPASKPAGMDGPVKAQRESRREPRPVQSRAAKPQPDKTAGEAVEASSIQKVYQERKRQAEMSESKPRTADRGRLSTEDAAVSPRHTGDKEEPVLDFRPDQDRLIEGLIWAEVLGQPRAKKPYSPGRRD